MKFSVLISGTPPLTIKWFRNRREILSGVDCSIQKDDSSSSLELFFTKPTDSGEYNCEISNDVGSDSCQTTLFVKGVYPILFLIRDASMLFLLLVYTYTKIINVLFCHVYQHTLMVIMAYANGNHFLK